MKKITFLSLVLVFMVSFSVHALSWAYGFVVWEGKVYEVKQEEVVAKSKVGKVLGKVKTKPNDMTGNYYGNASNLYPIGTTYYEIKGIETFEAIAVKEENQWVKAVYVHKASFHMMNVLTNPFFIFSVIFILIGFRFRTKKMSRKAIY